jgi:hypothetical protein
MSEVKLAALQHVVDLKWEVMLVVVACWKTRWI